MDITLSIARPPYIIPSYSLTGDLLAYLKCGLQYRYTNKGGLPPSKPVQLWFGEFVHAVMEETYTRWSQGELPQTFPWNWAENIRPLELDIASRLAARGLLAPYRLFCPSDGTSNTRCLCGRPPHPEHKLIASRRVDAAINTWGVHLFPLISRAEVLLQGIRTMPAVPNPRADYYEIKGIADVIGSVQITQAPRGNLILHYLSDHRTFQDTIMKMGRDNYEIILDYKGTRRPSTQKAEWEHYNWQVMTYAWLRNQQPDSAPVVAGIVLFLNELEPSGADMEELQEDVKQTRTDVMPEGRDRQAILNWRPGQPVPELTTTYREKRSIRIIPVDRNQVNRSLQEFDSVVKDIEQSVRQEMGGNGIQGTWQDRPSRLAYTAPEARTCTVCDFKHYCQKAGDVDEGGIPNAP